MTPQALAWILSLVAALAFVGLGYVLGRRRASGASVEAPEPAVEDDRGAPSPSQTVGLAASRASAAGSREEALGELLGVLDRGRGSVVLADSNGLPMAGRGDLDAETMAVLAGAASSLMARVEEVLPDLVARGVDVRVGEGTLRVRPLNADSQGPVVASLSRTPASDADFESVREELWRLVTGSPAAARKRPEKTGGHPR